MTTRTMNRSGILLIISGIMTGVAMLVHPDAVFSGNPGISWPFAHFLLGGAALLGLFGLAGLYSIMRAKIIVFGQWAFFLAILGNILIAGLMFFFEATIVPVLAIDPAYRPLLTETGPLSGGSFGIASLSAVVLWGAGWMLLAAFLMGTRTLSPANGLVLLAGVPLLSFSPPLPFAAAVAGGVMTGAGVSWLGVSLWRGRAHEALKEILRLSDECFIQAGGHA